uniref:Uncharacterized protein LOC111109523 isoform X2 n=1 Tax=Crassostrea virginica TaxID=6565 RepID=A0A8B8BEE5_CRAVI|nr:uncharacterized protein LOC111109523 isoform X2 [Crassostrea virginica]
MLSKRLGLAALRDTLNIFFYRNFTQRKKPNFTKDLRMALENYTELHLRPIKIQQCDFGKPFSKVSLEYTKYTIPADERRCVSHRPTCNTKNRNILLEVKFSKVFEDGFKSLKDYVYNNGRMDSGGLGHACALSSLLVFLTELHKHEQLLQNGFRRYSKVVNPETYIAALLTNHLLSCLVFGSQYRISNDYRDQPPFCPCKDITCDKHIVYGQTSLGTNLNNKGDDTSKTMLLFKPINSHGDVWYGRPDVLLFPKQKENAYMVPLWYINTQDEENEEMEDMHSLEIKRHSKFEKYASQVLSQAIIFAFYQSNLLEKRRIEPLSTLVPSLVITPDQYYIIMYDYKRDILLSNEHQVSSLWEGNGLNLSAILDIWMVVNYKDFTPHLKSSVAEGLDGSSNFHSILKSRNIFDETKRIRMPRHPPSKTYDDEENMIVQDAYTYFE